MVDDLCRQGGVGLRNIGKICAVVVLAVFFLPIVMYALWRRTAERVTPGARGTGITDVPKFTGLRLDYLSLSMVIQSVRGLRELLVCTAFL